MPKKNPLDFEYKVVGAEEIIGTLDRLIKNIDNLHKDASTELLVWRSEDMRRSRPEVITPSATEVYTMIYPRSRASPGRYRTRRYKYILRPELLDMLDQRMMYILRRLVPWL